MIFFIIFNKRKTMTLKFIILQIIIPLLSGAAIYVAIDKIFVITEKLMWLFSFRGRRAYRSLMKGDVLVSTRFRRDDYIALKIVGANDKYYANIWIDRSGIDIGIFDGNRCVFAGDMFKDKADALIKRLIGVCHLDKDKRLQNYLTSRIISYTDKYGKE